MKSILHFLLLLGLFWSAFTQVFGSAPPPPLNCPIVDSVTFTSVTANTAIFNCAAMDTFYLLEIQYRPVGLETWSSSWTPVETDTLRGLFACTDYEVRIRTHCSAIDTGAYDSTYTFTTGTASYCPNRSPIGYDDIVSASVHGPLGFNVLANDEDLDGDELELNALNEPEVEMVNGASPGNVNYASNGEITFTPNLDFWGTARIIYKPYDGTNFGAKTHAYVYIPKPLPHPGDTVLKDICDFLDHRHFDQSSNDQTRLQCPNALNQTAVLNPSSNTVPGWAAYTNSPDVNMSYEINNTRWINNPAYPRNPFIPTSPNSDVQPHTCTVSGRPNVAWNRALGLLRESSSFSETAYTRLKEPLIQGQTYRLTFYATAVNDPGNETRGIPASPFVQNTTRLFVALTGNPTPNCTALTSPFFPQYIYESGTGSFPIPRWQAGQNTNLLLGAAPNQRSYTRCNGWVQYTVQFVANSANLEYLAIGVDNGNSANKWYAFVDDIRVEGCQCRGDVSNGRELTFNRNANDQIILTQIIPTLQAAGVTVTGTLPGPIEINLGGRRVAMNGHLILNSRVMITNGTLLMAREANIVANRANANFTNVLLTCCEGYMWQGIQHYANRLPNPITNTNTLNVGSGSIVECAIIGLDSDNQPNNQFHVPNVTQATFRNNRDHIRFTDLNYPSTPLATISNRCSLICTQALERPFQNQYTRFGVVAQRCNRIFFGGFSNVHNTIQNCDSIGMYFIDCPNIEVSSMRIERTAAFQNLLRFDHGIKYLYEPVNKNIVGLLNIRGQSFINVPMNGIGQPKNDRVEFVNLDNGIYFEPFRGSKASLQCQYALFNQIDRNPTNTLIRNGIFVRAEAAGIVNMVDVQRCFFQNITDNAIYVRNAVNNATISQNLIRNAMGGICFELNSWSGFTTPGNFNISENRIDNVRVSIYSIQWAWSGSRPFNVSIFNHDLPAAGLITTQPGAQATYPAFPAGGVGISNSWWGIQAIANQQVVRIQNNVVSQIPFENVTTTEFWGPLAGIRVSNVPRSVIRDNVVENNTIEPNGAQNYTEGLQRYGIRVDGASQAAFICNNELENLYYGIAIVGSQPASTVAKNDMTNNVFGYAHLFNGDVGDQFRILNNQTVVYDNEFQSSFWNSTPITGFHIRSHDSQNAVTNYTLRQAAPYNPLRMGTTVVPQFVSPTSNCRVPDRDCPIPVNTVVSSFALTEACDTNVRIVRLVPGMPGTGSGLISYDEGEISQLAALVADTSEAVDTFAAVSRFETLDFVYHELETDSTLRDSSAVLDSFYVAQANTNRYWFEKVRLLAQPPQEGLATIPADSALKVLETITPDNSYEENIKAVLRVLLARHQDSLDSDLNNNERDTIYYLARQCRRLGGWPVDCAKGILLRYRPDSLGDFDTCLVVPAIDTTLYPRMGVKPEDQASSKELNSLQVYPNPTTGELSIDLNETPEMPLTATLTDLMGRSVMAAQSLTDANNVISLGHLPAGLYLMHIRNSTGEERIVKIVKQ